MGFVLNRQGFIVTSHSRALKLLKTHITFRKRLCHTFNCHILCVVHTSYANILDMTQWQSRKIQWACTNLPVIILDFLDFSRFRLDIESLDLEVYLITNQSLRSFHCV